MIRKLCIPRNRCILTRVSFDSKWHRSRSWTGMYFSLALSDSVFKTLCCHPFESWKTFDYSILILTLLMQVHWNRQMSKIERLKVLIIGFFFITIKVSCHREWTSVKLTSFNSLLSSSNKNIKFVRIVARNNLITDNCKSFVSWARFSSRCTRFWKSLSKISSSVSKL